MTYHLAFPRGCVADLRPSPSRTDPGTSDALAIDAQNALATASLWGLQGRPDISLGADVTSVAAFARLFASSQCSRFLQRVFTNGEIYDSDQRPERLAVRWAAKEAVAKVVGSGFGPLPPWYIEIRTGRNKPPAVVPVRGTAWPSAAHTWTWKITLSHFGDAALAVAIGMK